MDEVETWGSPEEKGQEFVSSLALISMDEILAQMYFRCFQQRCRLVNG